MKGIYSGLIGALCLSALAACAADTGDQVIIIYNRRVPESKAVAQYYAEKRHVPTNQIFGFSVSTNEDMSRTEFRDSLQNPLAKALSNKKLWKIAPFTIPATTNQPARIEWRPKTSSIRYAVLCYGMPLRISPDPSLKEKGAEEVRPELRRNEACVDSELALLPAIEAHLPLFGPLRNPLYTTTNAAWLNPTNSVLMVARLDGPTPEIARGLVDKALAAEKDGLWGRAYFDLRKVAEPGLKMGDDWIHGAAEIARHLGFETVVDDNPGTFPAAFPMSQIAYYAGWYDQDVSGPFAQSKVEFMPGAFAYHLHSYSAASLRSTNKFWAGPLLAKGATATMGCVNEPYLAGTPDIAVFTARFLFNGFTFGEAALACQPVLSWQTTVVGDPLYCPFGKSPEVLHDELQKAHSPLVDWSFLRLANINYANGKSLAEVVKFLEDLGAQKRSAILAEKLGDLYTAQGKPASAVYAYSQALKLDPSPLQRVRLRLTLAEKLTEQKKDAEAYENLQKLLEEDPAYPDQEGIYKKLLPLAQKLEKKEDAEKYAAEIKRLAPPKS